MDNHKRQYIANIKCLKEKHNNINEINTLQKYLSTQ